MTIDDLRKLISYDPETGQFVRLVKKHGWASNGSVNARGYRLISVGGMRPAAHRLAWALHFGEWPKGEIDHINGDRDDNRLVNLRDANREQNGRNRMNKRPNSTGFRGVRRNGRGWQAQIRINGKSTGLGTYATPEKAAAAYRAASIKYHGEFSPFVTGRAA
jgi:hypothetical protein